MHSFVLTPICSSQLTAQLYTSLVTSHQFVTALLSSLPLLPFFIILISSLHLFVKITENIRSPLLRSIISHVCRASIICWLALNCRTSYSYRQVLVSKSKSSNGWRLTTTSEGWSSAESLDLWKIRKSDDWIFVCSAYLFIWHDGETCVYMKTCLRQGRVGQILQSLRITLSGSSQRRSCRSATAEPLKSRHPGVNHETLNPSKTKESSTNLPWRF